MSGATVLVDLRKWRTAPHWRFEAHRLGEDEHGVWLGAPPPTHYSGPRGEGAFAHGFVLLVPEDRWFVASWNDAREPDVELYVDIATPARWPAANHLTAVDLDLDVIRRRNGHVFVDDADEFEEHRTTLAYPQEVVASALAAAEEILGMARARLEPFGAASDRWMAMLTG